MAKSNLAFAPLPAAAEMVAFATAQPVIKAPSAVVTLTPKAAPSPRALAFNYAGLFPADALSAAFNEDLVKQALNGRVSAQFVALASTHGLIVPVSKADFEVWSRLILADHVAPFRAMKKSLAYAEALACMRECMGLEAVKRGAWPVKAKAAPKAEKPAYVMTPAAQAIVAKVRDAELEKADLLALIAAIKAQIV